MSKEMDYDELSEPLNRLIKEGTIGDCPICLSTTEGKKWGFFGEDLGCIQPGCGNYEGNTLEERNLVLAKNLIKRNEDND